MKRNLHHLIIFALIVLILINSSCKPASNYQPGSLIREEIAQNEPAPQKQTVAMQPQVIFDNINTNPNSDFPPIPPTFTLTESWHITSILVMHWNHGQGAEPGEITILNDQDNVFGTWQAEGVAPEPQFPNTYWVVRPDRVLEPGTYIIYDSDPETLSYNAESDNMGMVKVKGFPESGYLNTEGIEGIVSIDSDQFDPDIAYTVDEIFRSPSQSVQVSPTSPIAQLGAVRVNFDAWNLSVEDELVLYTLPEKTNKDGNTSFRGYDLSLSSGQNTFLTPVTVTIPRTVGEEEEGSVMVYDEVAGEWSHITYEVSEDGGSYLAYVPHFSVIGEKKVKKFAGTEPDMRSAASELSPKGSVYQYMGFSDLDGNIIPLVRRNVYMSDSSFQRLFFSIKTDELKRLLLLAELPSQDATSFALGTLNDAQSLADVALMASRVDAALSAVGKINLSGAMAGFGGLLTAGRIAYQANKGGSFAAILLENKYDIMEGILGGMAFGASYVGAVAAATVFSVAAATVFAWSSATGFYDYVTEYDSYQEEAYRFFMDQKKPQFSIHTLHVGLRGDFELGINGENFAQALKHIYDAYANKPKELDNAVAGFYTEYANLFWTALTDAQREAYYNDEYMGGSSFLRREWEAPSQEVVDKYTSKVVGRAVSESEPILRAFARGALGDMQTKLYRTMKLEVEPYLNEKLTFIVRDMSLKKDETFDLSRYADHEIAFSNRTDVLFTPRFVKSSAYTDEVYTPKPHKDSDVIYEITMYHYMQMGCPTKMTFFGDPKNGLPEITVDFTVDAGEVEILLDQVETEAMIRFEDPDILYLEMLNVEHTNVEHSFGIYYKDLPPDGYIEMDMGDGNSPYRWVNWDLANLPDLGEGWHKITMGYYPYDEEGNFTVTARMYTKDGALVAEGSILVIIKRGPPVTYQTSPIFPPGD